MARTKNRKRGRLPLAASFGFLTVVVLATATASQGGECLPWLTLDEVNAVLKTEAEQEFTLTSSVDDASSSAHSSTGHTTHSSSTYPQAMFQLNAEYEWANALEDGEEHPFLVCHSQPDRSGRERSFLMAELFPSLQTPGSDEQRMRMSHNENEALCNTKQHTCWVIPTTAREIEMACQNDSNNSKSSGEGTATPRSLRVCPLGSTTKMLGSTIESMGVDTRTLQVVLSRNLSTSKMVEVVDSIMRDMTRNDDSCRSSGENGDDGDGIRSLQQQDGDGGAPPPTQTRYKFFWSRLLQEQAQSQSSAGTTNNNTTNPNTRHLRSSSAAGSSPSPAAHSSFEPQQQTETGNASTSTSASTSLAHLHASNPRAQMWQRALTPSQQGIDDEGQQCCGSRMERDPPSFTFLDDNHAMEIIVSDDMSPDCILSLLAAISTQSAVAFLVSVPPLSLFSDISDSDSSSSSSETSSTPSLIQMLAQGGTSYNTSTTTSKSKPWYEEGITGKNQIVGVADTGLDYRHCYLSDDHQTFDVSIYDLIYCSTVQYSAVQCSTALWICHASHS
jgi:hypothetical protein